VDQNSAIYKIQSSFQPFQFLSFFRVSETLREVGKVDRDRRIRDLTLTLALTQKFRRFQDDARRDETRISRMADARCTTKTTTRTTTTTTTTTTTATTATTARRAAVERVERASRNFLEAKGPYDEGRGRHGERTLIFSLTCSSLSTVLLWLWLWLIHESREARSHENGTGTRRTRGAPRIWNS
jgi:hypothetical protein